ncbi:Uncharacterised protein [Mycobacteroides abscessus subsp. abscessus]|nr:Uncharacterised protein [Mycobacteroides abscessus subsp. abscessus]
MHTYLFAKALGDIGGAGVVEADPQRDNEWAVRLRGQLWGNGLDGNLGDLGRHLLEVIDGGRHVGDRRIRAGRGDQRQGRRALFPETGLHRVVDLQ